MHWKVWALVAMSSFGLAGCGGGEGAPPGDQQGVATLGAAGGTVMAEGGVKVTFPPQALTADVTVRIAKDGTGAPPLPPAASAAGAVYVVTPHGGPLRVHAEISIPVERKDLGATEQLVLLTAQPGDLQWTVLSGATYGNGEMRAPVMHFSYFQVVTLSGISMPSLVATISPDGLERSNNVGGPGVARMSPGHQFEPWSLVQMQPMRAEVKLTYPAPSLQVPARPFGPGAPAPCLPVSYGHDGATWRFVRNGTENVTPVVQHRAISMLAEPSYPRFESEIGQGMFGGPQVSGMGAMHVYGQDQPRRGDYAPANGRSVWATPPAGNIIDNDVLTWSGQVEFLAEPHNGHMRIDVAIATSCNLMLEAASISFRLNLQSRDDHLNVSYRGVGPTGERFIGAVPGSSVVIPFAGVESQSVRFEFARDPNAWQVVPVAAQYIRDDGPSGINHRYAIVIPNVQPEHAGAYRAWACSLPEPATASLPAVPSLCLSRTAALLSVATGPPVVTRAPVARIVQAGEHADFDVGYDSPVPATVQWQRRPLIEAAFNVGTWTNIAVEANFNLYFTPPATAADSGMLYRAVVSNALGSTASAAVLLTVVDRLDPPGVIAHPASITVAEGGTAVFVATVASAGSPSYQWQRNGVDLIGSNTPVLTLNNVSTANAGSYRLVVTNQVGTVATKPGVLTVSASPVNLPPTITAPPTSITVAAGGSANFAVGVSGIGPYSYAWYRNGATAPIQGASGAGFGIAAVTMADAGSYTVRVSNGIGSVTSLAATLTVTAGSTELPVAPVIATPPVGLAVMPGASATFAVAVNGSGPLSYQWRLNGIDIPGATAAVLHIASASALDAGSYSLEARNAVGVANSPSAPLVIVGAPAISAQPLAMTVSEGAAARLNVTATGVALRYQWTRNGVAIAGATAATYDSPPLSAADTGVAYAVVVYNGAGVVFSQSATVTVTPTPPPPTALPTISKAAAGYQHTCAIRVSGSLACWGYNSSAQLGLGDRLQRNSPTTVALPEATSSVAAGFNATCALGASGTLRCWGDPFASTLPVVIGGVNGVEVGGGVVAVTVGRSHACVLTSTGNVWCRGSNSAGQLGNASTVYSEAFVTVQGAGGLTLTNVASISASDFRTCAVRNNGSVMCWGQDSAAHIAVDVGGLSSITQVSGDCALQAGGIVLCWSGIDSAFPLAVVDLTDVARIGFGGPNCALLLGGTVRCWGDGIFGNGQGFEINRPPSTVSGLNAVGAIAAGGGHTCALGTGATLRCWGSGQYGQLGVGDTGGRTVPTIVIDSVGWAPP